MEGQRERDTQRQNVREAGREGTETERWRDKVTESLIHRGIKR